MGRAAMCWAIVTLTACGGGGNGNPGGDSSGGSGGSDGSGSSGYSDLSCAGGEAGGVQASDVSLNLNGSAVSVCQYSWPDSRGLPRTLSLKKQGNGNPGNGGYAVQATYKGVDGQTLITVNAAADEAFGGFGYFVSHEKYRWYDGANTIAQLHGEDDSARGLTLPSKGGNSFHGIRQARHRIQQNYYRWGTTNAWVCQYDADMGQCSNGETPKDLTLHKRYDTPVTIDWYIEAGTDYPRIAIHYDISAVPQAGLVMFDVRGPYGAMEFANSETQALLQSVVWKDASRVFRTLNARNPLHWNTPWRWNGVDDGVNRMHIMSTQNGFETGLLAVNTQGIEPAGLAQDDYAGGFGKDVNNDINWGVSHRDQDCSVLSLDPKSGCYELPLSGVWPYQGANYSYVAHDTPSTNKLLAWGSHQRLGSTEAGMFGAAVKYETCWGLDAGKALSGGSAMKLYQQAVLLKAGNAKVCASKF
ncbi:hypothetical protein B9Z51_05705 [Limnohabitans sp. T6-5]|nr:hypothetical protein B9Z51_05705 [Limnohabitans sp. T6-5]